MMQLSILIPKGRNAWILIGGVLGVVLMGFAIVLGPVRLRLQDLDARIITQERKLARNLSVLTPKAKELVEKQYDRYGTVIRMKGSTEEESALMLSEVDRLAGQSKVTLLTTKPREPKKDGDSESYFVDIEIEATVAQLVSFVYAIETSAQLLRVDRLVVDVKGAKTADAVRGTLSISKVVTL